jgi:hypothetical protein
MTATSNASKREAVKGKEKLQKMAPKETHGNREGRIHALDKGGS